MKQLEGMVQLQLLPDCVVNITSLSDQTETLAISYVSTDITTK